MVRGVSQLDVGAGFEGGIAVVILAIYLDRTTNGLARPRRHRRPKRSPRTQTAQAYEATGTDMSLQPAQP